MSRTCAASSATTPAEPWLIETVPAAGYRLVASVERSRDARPVPRRAAGDPAGGRAGGGAPVAGFVVNRAASRSLEDTLGPRAAGAPEPGRRLHGGGPARGVGGRGMQALVRRVARQTGGIVRVVDDDRARSSPRPAGCRRTSRRSRSAPTCPTRQAAARSRSRCASPSAPFLRRLQRGAARRPAAWRSSHCSWPRRSSPAGSRGRCAKLPQPRGGWARATWRPVRRGRGRGVDRAGRAFNDMAARLERSEALRRRAASDLAHDLATPATVLESQIQAMVDGVVPADAAQMERARAAARPVGPDRAAGRADPGRGGPAPAQRRAVGLLDLASEVVAGLEASCASAA